MSGRNSEGISLEAWLVSRDAGKQALAAETLAQMGSGQSVGYLIALARREETRCSTRCAVIGGLWLAIGVSLIILKFHLRRHIWLDPGAMLACTQMVAYLAAQPSAIHRKSIDLLIQTSDARALPVLVKRWMSGTVEDINPIARAVARLLRELTAESASLLSKSEWRFLLRRLAPRKTRALQTDAHRQLVSAVLSACAILGKVEALPQIKTLAESKSKSPEIQALQPTAYHYLTLLQDTPQAQPLAVRR